MSDFDSSESENEDNDDNYFQKKPFQYDYFLSNSTDVFQSWKNSIMLSSSVEAQLKNMTYLQLQFPYICRIDKFRTANVIRSNGFTYILRLAFQDLQKNFNKIFNSQDANYFKNKNNIIKERSDRSKILQKQLKTLLSYLDVVLDQGLHQFFNDEEKNFTSTIFQIISTIFTFITHPRLLGNILNSQIQLTSANSIHSVSLGGNHSYYQNIMRSLLKKNLKLKQIYDNLSVELKNEKTENMQQSTFLIKMISEVWNLKKDQKEEKDRRDFIDAMKGLYYLYINLRDSSISYQYIFSIFHLEYLETHRIFINYQQLQHLYINLLKQSKYNSKLINLIDTFSLENFPFQKRKMVPQIEMQTLDIVYNYIAIAKHLLGENNIFSDIVPVNLEQTYESSKYLLQHESVNGLVGLIMSIQENSKDAFSLGGIQVHKIYVKMSELLKQIYLSYEHDNWLFPTNILLYIPLSYFISISDDIKADVKKTLFQMVNVLNQNRMPHKLIYREGKIVRQKVERAEYLQVILYFLQECRRQQQYINLPEIVPSNMETSVLYVKSLESKLNGKEPNQDQKPYFKNMLQFCQQYKVNINFKWFEQRENNDDREIEFNIEKGLPEEWMRHIYRQTINQRQSENIESYIEKYRHNKGLSILRLVNILKFNHGLNPAEGIPDKSIREQDLFLLMDQIRMILSIKFDIFNLNLDEEVSLNYLHVCLGFYNNTIKQAPGNQCYYEIMEKIMIPYLQYPKSSQSKFKCKYPGFFANWIYSFQIKNLFFQLGGFIEEHAGEADSREDIIAKIQLVSEFLDNKQNIEISTSLEQLTQTIVTFSTLLNPSSIHPSVYLEGVQLFCLFLNTFPAIKNQASLDFLFSPEVLQDSQLVDFTLAHVRKYEGGGQNEVSILNGLVKNLSGYMNHIGLKKSMEVIQTYIEIKKATKDKIIDAFTDSILLIPNQQQTFLSAFFKFIVILKKLADTNDEDEGQQKQDYKEIKKSLEADMLITLQQLEHKFIALQKDQTISMEGVLFTDIIFLDQVLDQLEIQKNQLESECKKLARSIFRNLVKNYGRNEDLMYFAQKLSMSELILISKMDESRQQALLVDLIIENKHKQIQTELIKRLLRENAKLSDVAEKAISKLSKQRQKIHSYHINRFIQINSRYPQQIIQKFLLMHIGCERNNSNAKIHQQYLINDLIKKLQKVPKGLCEVLLLKPIKADQKEKLIELISDIFEQILYLPIKKFDKLNMNTVQEQEDEDWNTQSENEEQTKQQRKKSTKEEKQKSNQSFDEPIEDQHEGIFDSEMDSCNDDEDNRPQFLQIFTQDQKKGQLKVYEQIMALRQELDVLIDSDYSKLGVESQLWSSKQIVEIVIKISKLMNQIEPFDFSLEMCYKMPSQLYQILRGHGLLAEIEPQMQEKIKKRKQPTRQKPKWMFQYFSDRDQSDDSNIVDDGDAADDYADSQLSDSRYEEDQYNDEGDMDDDEDDQEDQYGRQNRRDRFFGNKGKEKKKKGKKHQELDIPELLPTYSKIEKQINGCELKRQQLIKIMQIALYLLLNLPESQIKSRHVTSFYIDLLESNFGQMFLESFMTVIRFDETKNNIDTYLKSIQIQKQSGLSIGLQEVSMEDAINNIIYLIKQYSQTNQNKENYSGNILFKESGTLLPIAEQMMLLFDLPIQNNCITLLLIYIETNKAKIRRKIAGLNFTLQGHQIADKQTETEYKLKKTQISRIIEKICTQKSSNVIWETIEGTMNLKVNKISKLFACIKGYGNSLYKKVKETGQKILKTIKNSENELNFHPSEHEKQRNVENTYHIISKLILSCKEQIKQFYFINKTCLREIMEENDFDMDQIAEVKRVPKILLKNKDKLLKNKELINLCEIMMYFVKYLKDQFQGKIEDKMFSKLIHYPKMIIEACWFYIFLYAKHEEYFWTSPSQIQTFFNSHSFIGNYAFKNLQQVFNLVIYFLNLQSFCTDKFKQFFMPVLMKNHLLAREISLRFKIPKVDQDVNPQNILVTRKCSFDMAFYQVTGQAITVQFHGEQGSDHGGLVRQLMIGWKGRGIGQQAFFIGKILGISFKQGIPYGGSLDLGMFVAITNYTPTITFFQDVEPEIYKSLMYIRDNDPTDLCLKFTVQKKINGKLVQFQLIQGGRNIDLMDKNKNQYLDAYSAKYFWLGREKQLEEIKIGFNTVVFTEFAEIFTPFEMLKQIRGEEIVDVKMLISKAKYQGFSIESPVIKWFWSFIESFDQEKMNMLIQFVTGSPKITVYNSNFSIVIEKVFDVNCLPVAHTCFNTLDLPEYSTREILQKKLMTAISQGNNSFGIL